MNKVEYIGRLTSDGNLSFSTTGSAFYSNTIAVDRKYKKDGEEKITDFFRFKMFSKSAETFEHYTHKGSKVFLAGRNQIDEYTNKEGQKVRDVVLYVDEFEFLDAKQNTQETSKNDFLDVPEGLVEELPFL
jgi:single-strand DNA-binding protein